MFWFKKLGNPFSNDVTCRWEEGWNAATAWRQAVWNILQGCLEEDGFLIWILVHLEVSSCSLVEFFIASLLHSFCLLTRVLNPDYVKLLCDNITCKKRNIEGSQLAIITVGWFNCCMLCCWMICMWNGVLGMAENTDGQKNAKNMVNSFNRMRPKDMKLHYSLSYNWTNTI